VLAGSACQMEEAVAPLTETACQLLGVSATVGKLPAGLAISAWLSATLLQTELSMRYVLRTVACQGMDQLTRTERLLLVCTALMDAALGSQTPRDHGNSRTDVVSRTGTFVSAIDWDSVLSALRLEDATDNPHLQYAGARRHLLYTLRLLHRIRFCDGDVGGQQWPHHLELGSCGTTFSRAGVHNADGLRSACPDERLETILALLFAAPTSGDSGPLTQGEGRSEQVGVPLVIHGLGDLILASLSGAD